MDGVSWETARSKMVAGLTHETAWCEEIMPEEATLSGTFRDTQAPDAASKVTGEHSHTLESEVVRPARPVRPVKVGMTAKRSRFQR